MSSRPRAPDEISEALAIWRETRMAAAADAIDEMTRGALVGWKPPVHSRNQPFHEAWLVEARDVVHRGWACEALLTKLPAHGEDGDQQTRMAKSLVARLDALANEGPDPRVARAVIRTFVTGKLLLRGPEARDACVRALAQSLDERTIVELERSRPTVQPWNAELIDRALAQRPASRAPTRTETARFERVDESPLWREVFARPDDDAPRTVLADVLQTRGDPRGEYIALQLADRQPGRQAVLLKQYGVDWLGNLRACTYRAQFRRGFVAGLELGSWRSTSAEGWDQLVGDPVLATVEELFQGRALPETYARFVVSPAMTALRRIDVFNSATIDALAKTTAKLEHVSCTLGDVGTYGEELATRVLPECERHATLVSLGFFVSAFEHVARSTLFPRLQALRIGGPVQEVLALLPRMPRGISLTIAPPRIDGCFAKAGAWQGALRLVPSGDTLLAYASGEWFVGNLAKYVDALPRQVTRLELEHVTPATAQKLREAANARSLELDIKNVTRAPKTGYMAIA